MAIAFGIIAAILFIGAIGAIRRRGRFMARHAFGLLSALVVGLLATVPSAPPAPTASSAQPPGRPAASGATIPAATETATLFAGIDQATLVHLQADLVKVQAAYDSISAGATGWRVEGSSARASLIAGETALPPAARGALFDLQELSSAQQKALAPLSALLNAMIATEQRISADTSTPDTSTFSGTAAVAADIRQLAREYATLRKYQEAVAQASGVPLAQGTVPLAPHSTVLTNAGWDPVVADPQAHVGDAVSIVVVWGGVIADSGSPAYYAAYLEGHVDMFHQVAVMDPSAFQTRPAAGSIVRVIGTIDGVAIVHNAAGATAEIPEVTPTSVSPVSATASGTTTD